MIDIPACPTEFDLLGMDEESLSKLSQHIVKLEGISLEIREEIKYYKRLLNSKLIVIKNVANRNTDNELDSEEQADLTPIQLSIRTEDRLEVSTKSKGKANKTDIGNYLKKHGPMAINEILKEFPEISKMSIVTLLGRHKTYFRQNPRNKKWSLNLSKA